MISHLERVPIPSNAQRADLIRKPNLDVLQLGWHDGDDIKIEAQEEVLKGLQPHKNLKELWIEGYGGIHFPGWMTAGYLLPSIVKMTLQYCRNCEILPPLVFGSDMSERFPSLEVLKIEKMRSLKVWSGLPSKRVFPSLKYLMISGCPNLKSLPEGIGNLLSLKTLLLIDVGLTSLPEEIGNLSSLEELKLFDVGLTSLPEGFQRLTGLQSLTILKCLTVQRRCQEAGEDFHKIRHIPKVKFSL